MKKTILLLLTLTLILGVFTSCGYKTTDLFDAQTSSSPSEDTTVEREATTEETDEDIDTESSEESIETTSFTETVNTPETMESIETEQGGNRDPEKIPYTYTIKKVDGKWYMDFNSYVTSTPPQNGDLADRNFTFSSFDELYNTLIVDKNFTQNDMVYFIDTYYKTENGIEIINFDELYVPILPSGLDITDVRWFPTAYIAYVFDRTSNTSRGQITPISAKTFDDAYYDAVDFTENEYFLIEGDKMVVVKKRQINTGIDIYLYVKHGDQYCLVQLFDLTEAPTDEFFLKFGLKKWQTPE